MKKLLQLPPRYDLVVGDTFELFYKGIVFCKNSDFYDFELSFTSGKNLGKGFDRKYIWEPTAEDIGTHHGDHLPVKPPTRGRSPLGEYFAPVKIFKGDKKS